MPTQKDLILSYLQQGFTLTPLQALHQFGCFRLSAVIFNLRAEGYSIESKLVRNSNNKKFAQYKLIKTDELF
jgi:hypothetical protein